jgi:hypothetical protein
MARDTFMVFLRSSEVFLDFLQELRILEKMLCSLKKCLAPMANDTGVLLGYGWPEIFFRRPFPLIFRMQLVACSA